MATWKNGRQVPDPRPVEAPTGLRAPLSLHEEIQRYVRGEMARRAAQEGYETFEEANDFGDPDDFDDDFPEDTLYTFQPMKLETGDPGDASEGTAKPPKPASETPVSEASAEPTPARNSTAP